MKRTQDLRNAVTQKELMYVQINKYLIHYITGGMQ
jgi:hypothetical protein